MEKVNNRNSFVLNLAKSVIWPTVKANSFKKYDVPQETLDLIVSQNENRDCSLFFVGPHRSMWETVGIPFVVNHFGGQIPFAAIGNNLVSKKSGKKKALFDFFTSRIGSISVEREKNPRAAIPALINSINKIVSTNNNFLSFPEGTRSRDGFIKPFKPTVFQGAIAAAKTTDVYVVPFNVDYSILYEMDKFTQDASEIYRFKVKDFRKWRATFLDDIYISFGKPIKISSSDTRNSLATDSRKICVDLVKILRTNVVSEAIVRLNPKINEYINPRSVEASVDNVLEDLSEFEERFRGFNASTPSKDIIEGVKQKINPYLMPAYKIYANYIAEYLK